MHIIWMLHNVYPVYEANVMYQYKLVAKVGTALAPHWWIRREYQALVHRLSTLAQVPAQGRSGCGDIISSAENKYCHHSGES